jgi:hypothetical protein
MVGDRQRRNWGAIQFERVDDEGVTIAAGTTMEKIGKKPIRPVVNKHTMPEVIKTVEEHLKSTTPEPEIVESVESEVIEPEVLDAEPRRAKYTPFITPEDVDYKPSRRQIAAKLRFHKHCPPAFLLKFNPSAPTSILPVASGTSILEYVGQISQAEFDHWLSSKGFWEWFITDDDVDAKIYSLKQKAAEVLQEALEMDAIMPDGSVDMKVKSMQLRAAESVLNRNRTIKVDNKTINIKNNFQNAPKALLSADTVTLEQRLAQLKENTSE